MLCKEGHHELEVEGFDSALKNEEALGEWKGTDGGKVKKMQEPAYRPHKTGRLSAGRRGT